MGTLATYMWIADCYLVYIGLYLCREDYINTVSNVGVSDGKE